MIKVLLNSALENYDAPKCSVVEISTQSVLCGSPRFGNGGEPGDILDEDDDYIINL